MLSSIGVVGALSIADVSLTSMELLLAVGVLLLGGILKGTVGFAVGLVTISGLVQLFPPKLALVALSIPFLLSNVIVLVRDGVPRRFVRQQLPFIATLSVGLFRGRRAGHSFCEGYLPPTGVLYRGIPRVSAVRPVRPRLRPVPVRRTSDRLSRGSSRGDCQCTRSPARRSRVPEHYRGFENPLRHRDVFPVPYRARRPAAVPL